MKLCLRFSLLFILLKLGLFTIVVDNHLFTIVSNTDIANLDVTQKLFFIVSYKSEKVDIFSNNDEKVDLNFNKKISVFSAVYKFEPGEIHWDQVIRFYGRSFGNKVTLKFKDKYDGIRLFCPIQYIIKGIAQQSFCTYQLSENITVDLFRKRIYFNKLIYVFNGTNRGDIQQGLLFKSGKKEYTIPVKLVVKNDNGMELYLNRSLELKLINSPMTFTSNFDYKITHSFDIAASSLLFKFNSNEFFIEKLVKFIVDKKTFKTWNVQIVKHKMDFLSFPKYYSIELIAFVFLILNTKLIPFSVFNHTWFFLLYEGTDVFQRNFTVITNQKVLCPIKLPIYDGKTEIDFKINDGNINFFTEKNQDKFVSVNWPEKHEITLECFIRFKLEKDTPDAFKTSISRIFNRRSVFVTKLTYKNCVFKPGYIKILLPETIRFNCECYGKARISYQISVPPCKISLMKDCKLHLDCHRYQNKILNISVMIYFDSKFFIHQIIYEQIYMPTVVFYLPQNPMKNQVIRCETDSDNRIFKFLWTCEYVNRYKDFFLVDFFSTVNDNATFYDTAPIREYNCVCQFEFYNFLKNSVTIIKQPFIIDLKDDEMKFCEIPFTIKSYSHKTDFMLTVILSLILFMVFPFIAYLVTELKMDNMRRKEALTKLGMKQLVDFSKFKFQPIYFTKKSLESDQFDLYTQLIEKVKKNEVLIRKLRAGLENFVEKSKIEQKRHIEFHVSPFEKKLSFLNITKKVPQYVKIPFQSQEHKQLSSTQYLHKLFNMKTMRENETNETRAHKHRRYRNSIGEILYNMDFSDKKIFCRENTEYDNYKKYENLELHKRSELSLFLPKNTLKKHSSTVCINTISPRLHSARSSKESADSIQKASQFFQSKRNSPNSTLSKNKHIKGVAFNSSVQDDISLKNSIKTDMMSSSNNRSP